MRALNYFIQYHDRNKSDGQRLGQRFVNMFCSTPWPYLFYMQDEEEAIAVIEGWLEDMQYTEELPRPLRSYIEAISKKDK
jgi:hypothetical protein